MRGSSYTIIFAAVISVCLSVLLSGISMVLKDRQDENRALEQQSSILRAAQVAYESKDEIKNLYEKLVQEFVIDMRGQVVEGKDPSEVLYTNKEYALLYSINDKDDPSKVKSFVYPVVGTGLWSKLFGYLAVDSLGQNVLGLIFYKQGETPGLGAEIEKEWFTDSFKGRSLFKDNKLVGVKVAKGSKNLDPDFKYISNSIVDGISGATITGDGVSAMLKKIPMRYEPFFKKRRQEL